MRYLVETNNRLRLLANRQRSFHFVFIDDDPRSHIQAHLPDTMDG